jgi:cell division protein FtsN
MSNKIKALIFSLFIAVFAWFCWYAYFSQVDYANEDEIPLLKAQSDIKSKPDDPGGMEVLNKDKAIYNHMLGKKKSDGYIRVIENSEKPVSKENLEDLINKQIYKGNKRPKHLGAVIIQPKSQVVPQAIDEQTKPEAVTEPKQVPQPSENPKKPEPIVTPKPQPVQIAEKAKQTEAAAPKDPKPQVIIEKYTIRVAKLKDKKFLAKGTEIFKHKFPVLSKYKGELVEIGDKYYLHFSSIKSKQEAIAVCQELTNQGNKCSIH